MSFARFTQAIPLLVMGLALLFAAHLAQAQTETVLYNFTGGSDGGQPITTPVELEAALRTAARSTR